MKLIEHLIARNGVSVKVYHHKGITTVSLIDPYEERLDFKADFTDAGLRAFITSLQMCADKLSSILEQEPDKPERKSFFSDEVLPNNYTIVHKSAYADLNPKEHLYTDMESDQTAADKAAVNFAYQKHQGDVYAVAKELGIGPMDVRSKVRRYQIKLEKPTPEDELPF
jgi:transcriptional regulator of acetoin/glycerol metabolism